MTRPVSLSTSSPRCSPLILALSSAASSPSASPSAPISPALLALAAAPGTILGTHTSSPQMHVAAREVPSPLLLASSPILASTSTSVTPSSSSVSMAGQSTSHITAMSSVPHQRNQKKSRNPAFTMSMPSPPRFASNANVNRMYAAQSSQQPQQQQPSQPSDATPYLMPVGSPLGPVTPMLLADEEFQFTQSSTSPSLSAGSSLSSSAGSTSSQTWARHRQMRYPQQPQQQPSYTTGSAAGFARVAPYASSPNPPTSSLLSSDLATSRQWSSVSPSPSPVSPLSPALSASGPDDDDVDCYPKGDL
ncbi:hypothetical protein V1525DRAFT_427672 [Lipomyces kononenkoae]|uniref:Uncharacterized protein n=1 Tax=Lipomyces kononenkoae TaxID=34357 RepID=A0ACC3SVN3_LIPKO